ncbi:nanos homolog 2 [Polymixia lowei]
MPKTRPSPARDHFDMWHDYMNLGRILEQVRGLREMESGPPGGPKLRDQLQARPRMDSKNSNDSINLSSSSSLSDINCSMTYLDFCRFCKQNGESAEIYRSHRLKSNDGKVICPILWSYTCPICYSTGDNAHTRRYCPRLLDGGAALLKPRFF